MNILTVTWSLGAGACLVLAVVQGLIWLRQDRQTRSWAHLLIATAALGAAVNALFEIGVLQATSQASLRWHTRHMHVSIAVVIVSLVWFLAIRPNTTRRWMAWAITNLWGFSLIANYLADHSLTYRKVTALKQVALPWGETYTLAQGIVNPWKIIADMASILFVIYVADASIRFYRQGDRRRALVVGGSVGFFILVDAGIIESPVIISLAFLAIVCALALELSSDILKVDSLTPEVTANEDRWQSLLENVQLAAVGLDRSRCVTQVNPYLCRRLGYTPEELIGRPWLETCVPESEREPVQKAFKQELHHQFVNDLQTRAGERYTFAWSNVQLPDSEILSVGEDITDRLSAEQSLADEKDRMNVILSALETGMVLIDRDLNVTWMNEKLRSLIPQGDPVGSTYFTFSEGRKEPREDRGVQLAFGDGKVHETQRYSEPQKRWFHIISQPIKDKQGTVTHVLESVTDVTEKAESHQKLEDALAEVTRLRDQLQAENTYLQQEIQAANNHEQMIGESRALKYVGHRISQVAETDTTVLVEGETGTGKELVARAIHARSQRADRPLIKVNCASLPASLIESELFGHEKGAFTGATQERKGHFELAHEGTIFLDEIGELPLETQAKLLNVLEDTVFIRVGSEKPRPLDVRVIAATSRNLEAEVKAGRFRRDLYDRLNVCSLPLPPLREREEDIPLLAQHFMEHFAKQQGKPITQISNQVVDLLKAYTWPGNVRELRNIIQRAVIASEGPDLLVPDTLLPGQKVTEEASPEKAVEKAMDDLRSLSTVQRDYILQVLRNTQGQLEGKGGAAEILKIKPSTLRNRMRKLGITREDIRGV